MIFGEVIPSSRVSEVELAREGVLGAGRSSMVATLVVLVAILGLVPILAPEIQTSGTVPALETHECSPASR